MQNFIFLLENTDIYRKCDKFSYFSGKSRKFKENDADFHISKAKHRNLKTS